MLMMLVLLVRHRGILPWGFALAVYFGHGPMELPFLKSLLNKRPQAGSPSDGGV